MALSKKLFALAGLFAVLALGVATNFLGSLVWGVALVLVAVIFFYFYPQISFYALVAYLPFQIALNLSSDIDLMSGRVLILLLFGVWLVRSFKEKKFLLNKNTAGLALVLFFLIALLSVLVAQNPGWGLRKVLFFLSIFPLFFLTKAFISDAPKTRKLLWVVVITATASALLAFGQFLAQFIFSYQAVAGFWGQHLAALFWGQSFGQTVVQNPSWYVNVGGQTLMRAVGLFPDPHMLAFYLGLTSPLVLVLAASAKKYRLWLAVVYLFLLIVLLLTFSRGGYLGLVLSVLAMLFLAWPRLGRPAKALLASFFTLVLAITAFSNLPVAGRFFSSFDISEGSNSDRLAIWQSSLAQTENNPLLGVGLGNYPLAINFNEDYRSAVTSHNLYLDILVETGILGLAAWLWFMVSSARNALGQDQGGDQFKAVLSVCLFGSLVYFAVHAIFETPIFNPTILAVLMILAGLAAALPGSDKEKI